MSADKYSQHIYVIPEDDADRQIANGFVQHHEVDGRRIQVLPVANGWKKGLIRVMRTWRYAWRTA